jgi:hypothetical protein
LVPAAENGLRQLVKYVKIAEAIGSGTPKKLYYFVLRERFLIFERPEMNPAGVVNLQLIAEGFTCDYAQRQLASKPALPILRPATQ